MTGTIYMCFRVWVRYIFRLLSFVHCMRIIELLACTCELMYIAELIDYSKTLLFPPLFSQHISALHCTLRFSSLFRVSVYYPILAIYYISLLLFSLFSPLLTWISYASSASPFPLPNTFITAHSHLASTPRLNPPPIDLTFEVFFTNFLHISYHSFPNSFRSFYRFSHFPFLISSKLIPLLQ